MLYKIENNYFIYINTYSIFIQMILFTCLYSIEKNEYETSDPHNHLTRAQNVAQGSNGHRE